MRLVAAKARRDIDIKFLASVLCGILAVAANAFSASGTGEVSPDAHEALETPYMQKNLYSRLFGSEEPRHITWLCYYGQDREVLALSGYDLLILEADALGPVTKEDKGDRMCLAYMSIGEISQSRWFWPLVRDKPWLLEENPDWPDARRIDPRSPEWSDLLVDTIAPALLAAGYDGFLLDNADIGEYLENRDPAAYAGSSSSNILSSSCSPFSASSSITRARTPALTAGNSSSPSQSASTYIIEPPQATQRLFLEQGGAVI